ncbi:MAG: DNA polymerase III subunit delta [Thermomicrobiales bacterium]
MIALVLGPDAATARAAVTRLVKTHDPTDASTTWLDGRTVAIGQAVSMVGTPGFFGEARIVVIEYLMARAAKSKSSDGDEIDGNEAATAKVDLGPLFSAVLPQNVLILIDTTLSAIPAAVRKAAPSDANVIAGEPPRGQVLLDAMQRIAKDAGSDLAPAVAKYLADLLFPRTWAAKTSNPLYDRPPDIDLLNNEIEKLALTAHPGPIERQHVEEMTDAASIDRLFPFIEAAVGGSITRAAEELRALREASEDVHRLTAQLYQQVELAAVQDESEGRVDPVEVGRAIGLSNPNRMMGIARTRRAIPGSVALEQSREFDRKAKTGELRDPMDVLYGLIAAFADNPRRTATPSQRRSG